MSEPPTMDPIYSSSSDLGYSVSPHTVTSAGPAVVEPQLGGPPPPASADPVASTSLLPPSATASPPGANNNPTKSRRAFKACAHCRSRKARCDLGQVDRPNSPPCTRCRREGVECVFLPSRRGGRVPFAAQKRNLEAQAATQLKQEPVDTPLPVATAPSANTISAIPNAANPPNPVSNPYHNSTAMRPFSASDIGSRSSFAYPPPPANIFRTDHALSTGTASGSKPTVVSPNQASDGSPADSCESSGQRPLKRRRGDADAEVLAAASLRNPVDALDLLVAAAEGGSTEDPGTTRSGGVGHDEFTSPAEGKAGIGSVDSGRGDKVQSEPPPARLGDFPLVATGVLTPIKLGQLVSTFFERFHSIFPIVPVGRIPRTEQQLARFASQELHLTTVFCVIASRHDKDPDVHERSWAFLQQLLSQLLLGQGASIGTVEALLLLSEWLPRQPVTAEINAEENRFAWMLVGTALRIGYALGLDSKTLDPAKPFPPGSVPTAEEEIYNRERVAWTYAYAFDRQISIRTGKAFWSRGPQLCFAGGGAGGERPTATATFPSLRAIEGSTKEDSQDDFASLLQAYVDLTQIMTSCHDFLFPSRQRTVEIILRGEYYKYLDEFSRSLSSFRATWSDKRWSTYPLTECVWLTFHYLRLYVFGFAFQAHVHRATMNGEDREDPSLFPYGLTSSPDAKHITEAIEAAADLLRLVTDRLHPGGALPYLPWRFFMYISFSGVFLLKALYTQAVSALDRPAMLRLLKRVIIVLAASSADESHPGVRYAQLLNGLLRVFHVQDSAVQTRAASPGIVDNGKESVAATPARSGIDFTMPWHISNGLASASHPVEREPIVATAHNPPVLMPFAQGSSVPPSDPSTPFPMLPFAESQSWNGIGESTAGGLLDWDLDVDLGLANPALASTQAPNDIFSSFVLEDNALSFWNALSAPQPEWL